MRRSKFSVVLAVFAMAAVMIAGLGVAPAGAKKNSNKAKNEPIAICHYKQNRDYWKLRNVGPNHVKKHLDHGDGVPGDIVPGSGGAFSFGPKCELIEAEADPDPDPDTDGDGVLDSEDACPLEGAVGEIYPDGCLLPDRVLAGAYSTSSDGTTVTVAELIDTQRDGLPSAGDEIIMGQYPTTFDGSPYADFGVSSHPVTAVGSCTTSLIVLDIPAIVIGERSYPASVEFYSGAEFEWYREAGAGLNQTMLLNDRFNSSNDRLDVDLNSPSSPQERLDESQPAGSDDLFLDIDIFTAC